MSSVNEERLGRIGKEVEVSELSKGSKGPEQSGAAAGDVIDGGDGSARGGSRRHRRAIWPGPIVWLIAVAWIILAATAKITNFVEDHAVSNILFFVFTCNTGVTFLLWFLWFSGHSRRVRRYVFRGVIATLLCLAATVRPVRTSGDLLPSFRFVWQPVGSTAPPLSAFDSSPEGVDLLATTADDFPQFLGPDRNLKLSGPALDPDWESRPPKQVWRQAIGAGWSGFVTTGAFAVTMEQRDDQELVTCYQKETGKAVWAHGLDIRHATLMGGVGPRSTPTIDEGRVYALGATGVLLCLNGADGELLWKVDLPAAFGVAPGDDSSEIAWGRANSPLVVGSLVVIPAGGPQDGEKHSLAAYNKEDGELVWTGGDDQVSYSSPVVYTLLGQRQIVSVNENTVSGHRIEDGSQLWSLKWPGSSSGPANTSQPMLLSDNRLLVSKGYNRGAAEILLTLDGGSWSADFGWESGRVLKTKLTSTIVHKSHGYGLNDGIIQCVSLKDGSLVWKGDRLRHGQPLLVGDKLLVMSEWGDLYLYEASPDGGKRKQPLAVLKDALQGTAWNNLCLSGNRLLVRSDQEAACYELPTTGR